MILLAIMSFSYNLPRPGEAAEDEEGDPPEEHLMSR
jgi:hypothetical protein